MMRLVAVVPDDLQAVHGAQEWSAHVGGVQAVFLNQDGERHWLCVKIIAGAHLSCQQLQQETSRGHTGDASQRPRRVLLTGQRALG